MTGVRLSTARQQNVDAWRVFGHSWFQYQTGPSGDQTGRTDALFRSAMDVEYSNWRNYAVSGARIAGATQALGGWTRLAQNIQPPPGRVFPYAPDGGGTILGWGINDLGIYGGQLANVKNSIVQAYRVCISRARASRIYFTTDAVFAYGAGFTSNASGVDLGSGTVDRLATTTTSATITMTLPADYQGETVCFTFLHRADTTGGTITFSGTAGATGTVYTGSGLPGAFLTHGWTCKRVTGLTSANAGQTIILTATQMDASGAIFFDSAHLESLTPPPVLVVNIARLTLAGYNNSFYTAWTGTEAAHDADVVAVNASVAAVCAEFDGMVQVADVDTQIAKNAAYTSDGIHPNELGAGRIVDALLVARNNLTPPANATSYSMCFNPPAPRTGPRRMVRRPANWYTAVYASTGTYTPAAGDFWAIPFEITESRDKYTQLCMEVTTAGSVAGTIRWGIYDDVNYAGYPQALMASMDISSAGAFTVAASTGVKTSATFTTTFVPDPGLYWLVLKVDTAGTGQVYRALVGQSEMMPNLTTGGAATTLALGWKLTGQATGALPGLFPTGGAASASPPMIGILKST